ncbi:DUF6415 family natural product biosynthesis protein [Streptomyces sp. NPDC091281]|uniref:DUF6415 family natural product biosynthesis protein n=1 Tax=Streptomyces sp. NPDC091281 TaxID=3365985 RepID=UPI00381E95DE
MRDTARCLVTTDGGPVLPAPDGAGLTALTAALGEHLEALIPLVEEGLRRTTTDSVARHCALACLGDARLRLRAQPSARHHGALGHARRLARALRSLCEHYEQLYSLR